MNETEYDLLIRGCTALTSDPAQPVIDDAVIGIQGDRLAVVARTSDVQALQANRVIDGRGHVATPGFVNVHRMAFGSSHDAALACDRPVHAPPSRFA